MIQKSTIFAIITAMCLVACDGQGDSSTRKRKATSEAFKKLVRAHCAASDTVMYSLDDTVIELPCKHAQLSPHHHREVNYAHPSYLEGGEPIPLQSLQLEVKSPDYLDEVWDISPPIGVLVNLYAKNNSNLSQECKTFESKAIWCHHYIAIDGTNLGATLRFNAHSIPAFSSWTGKNITPDDFPYAYYPKNSWPQLYEQFEIFAESLLKEMNSDKN